MHSSSKSRKKPRRKFKKAQFFVLSAVSLIGIIFLVSRLFEPSNIIDTSSVLLNEAPFIFENIRENSINTVKGSQTCEEARFNLQEYKGFVEKYALGKGYFLHFNYSTTPCFSSPDFPFPILFVDVQQTLRISNVFLESNYSIGWPTL